MSLVGTAESTVITSSMIDVSHETLDHVFRSEDTWLQRAVERIRSEADAEPEAAVAAFQSSL